MPEKDRLDTILDALKPKGGGGSSFPLAKDTKAVVDRLTFPTYPAKHWWWTWPVQILVIAAIGLALVQYAKPDPVKVHKTGPDRPTATTVAR